MKTMYLTTVLSKNSTSSFDNYSSLMSSIIVKRILAILLITSVVASSIPSAAACETEVAKALEGKFPSPTGISPNKDDSMRETVRISKIGQETARFMLWEVLMGANYSERQIADEINRVMIENGSNPEWVSFDTIVASGANGAIPHGAEEYDGAGPKIVEIGDVVVVDLGARVNDWVSDITRTYVVGHTDNFTIIDSYMAVYEAQNLTFPVIEAGTPAWLPDDIARTHITEKGYGDLFIHSLGHGFGICVHEPPLLSSGNDDPLFGLDYNEQPLMVYDAVTVEPGIYHDGWFGIRIEDDFLVNSDGHEFLSEIIPRDLDWFMIEKGDYGENDSAEEYAGVGGLFTPFIGFDVLMLVAVAAVFTNRRLSPTIVEKQD
ncbi:MAG TPA: M24 family metallopeptidase [Candidatus Poseidoniales archaeon]|nr:M24 family metallopeptidase [Candidatus Poseidoniales archaeon]HIK77826.1 M24 family metallopeptidase [Candidatus Poseidoniales archaeon]